MESVTWAYLGLHDKPCGMLNVEGYFDDLLAFFRHAVSQGFVRERQMEQLAVSADVDTLLDALVGPACREAEAGATG
jgi:predicted Rossmann-fold nucleotide-binding protein